MRDFVKTCNAMSQISHPTGIVTSKRILKSGEQSVRVRSYKNFQAANKISLAHGQKGVDAEIGRYEDMPIC